MNATIEIEAGQIWECDGKLFHVESVDEIEGVASVGKAYRTRGGIFDGRITLIEADLKWSSADFEGGTLVKLPS